MIRFSALCCAAVVTLEAHCSRKRTVCCWGMGQKLPTAFWVTCTWSALLRVWTEMRELQGEPDPAGLGLLHFNLLTFSGVVCGLYVCRNIVRWRENDPLKWNCSQWRTDRTFAMCCIVSTTPFWRFSLETTLGVQQWLLHVERNTRTLADSCLAKEKFCVLKDSLTAKSTVIASRKSFFQTRHVCKGWCWESSLFCASRKIRILIGSHVFLKSVSSTVFIQIWPMIGPVQ